ncbi:MAG: ELM1/GtrOC1 family putative glycosyltransferase [Wenzhouxiangella sp.]|nr:ELM1/GtrOC1 family putative glycosyltransferase [Wenzhouxiangella sp.]
MALLAQRILGGLSPARFSRTRPPATETRPDRILLGPRPGTTPSTKPRVRIYLGSERHQFRAERAFLWSVEKHRDPARSYEIYLMRDLTGFSRGFWLTGFTNYRFAIPAFCGFEGRAIYNDADQIYLTDPAELFDLAMEDKGFLSINDRDTSVMLIDCERMRSVWTETTVRQKNRKQLEAMARAKDLWGDLDDGWNARDKEYDPKHSKLVHFTTLHTQPWRPFPGQLVYFDNPTESLWPDLEKDANAAEFLPFNATRPSRHWPEVNLYLTSKEDTAHLLQYLGPKPGPRAAAPIVVRALLEHVPDQDVLWVLDRLLAASPSVELHIKEPIAHGRGGFRRSLAFWLEHLELVSRWRAGCRWQLTHQASPLSRPSVHFGGLAHDGVVVSLLHRKPGHNAQTQTIAKALADRLGREHREINIDLPEWRFVLSRWLGAAPKPELPRDAAVVVAGGWMATRLARAHQQRHPHLRIVLAGRKSGPAPIHGGVIVQCAHFGLPPHPNRITTPLPLNTPSPSRPVDTGPWQDWLDADDNVACLLGGNTKSFAYTDQDMHALAGHLDQWAAQSSAPVLIVTSRRTGRLAKALVQAMSQPALTYHWQADDPTNPYTLALAKARALVVTGESESILADAAAAGKPFAVFWPERPPKRLFDRFSQWVAERATRPRYNRRGSIRPQQGLQYLCARALERHWVLPPRDLAALHRSLFDQGLAEPLDKTWPDQRHTAGMAIDVDIDRIVARLSLSQAPTSPTTED